MKKLFSYCIKPVILQTLASYLIQKCSMFAVNLSLPLEHNRMREGLLSVQWQDLSARTVHGTQEAINKQCVEWALPFLHLKSYFLNKTQQSLLIQPCQVISSHFSSCAVPCSQIQVIVFPKCTSPSLPGRPCTCSSVCKTFSLLLPAPLPGKLLLLLQVSV